MKRLFAGLALLALAAALLTMRHWLLNRLTFFPSRAIPWTPVEVGLAFQDVGFETEDGQRLHGWWIRAPQPTRLGHVLFFHGNAGNVSDRLLNARLLVDVGLDVFLFDYRGYGRSAGSPDEPGTYRDARAARAALLRQPTVEASRVVYLGESLGGGVALAQALEAPPLGLVLQSSFTSVKDLARLHYPFVPGFVVPDAYPNLERIAHLRAPLLIIHGERDEIVPLSHGQLLFDRAPKPKRLQVVNGAGHNDLVLVAGKDYGSVIASWLRGLIAVAT